MAMAASSALQLERCILPHAGPRRRLLRMLPPRAPHLLVLPHRRRGAVRRFSRDGGGGGGPAGAVEKRSVVPEVAAEKKGGGDALAEEVAPVDGALELRWPPWEGLPERYRLIGATSLAFVICNMDK